MKEEFLFVEKYRPKTIEECILPIGIKTTFLNMQKQGEVPNLLLAGGPGVGKTSVVQALFENLQCDYTIIPASIKGNIDTLRNEIASFASSMSFKGKRKYVILDEADYLTHATQPALRNVMNDFARNCGFVLTVNYLNKIIVPLQSRCSVIEFNIPKEDRPELAKDFFYRVRYILDEENVKYNKSVLVAVIEKYFPLQVLEDVNPRLVNTIHSTGHLISTQSFKDFLVSSTTSTTTRFRRP